MPATLNSSQKTTQLRIQRALSKPGAVGMKGLLLWTEAAWPKAIADKVLAAANRYTPGAQSPITLASPAKGGFGLLGDFSVPDPNNPNNMISLGVGQTLGTDSNGSTLIINSDGSIYNVTTGTTTDPSVPPVSGTTLATPSQPATPSWAADVSDAFKTAAQAGLGIMQLVNAQTLFNNNLKLAMAGKPMIPTNPTQYGLPAPTANIGLTTETEKAMLWGIGLLAGGVVLASALRGHRKARR